MNTLTDLDVRPGVLFAWENLPAEIKRYVNSLDRDVVTVLKQEASDRIPAEAAGVQLERLCRDAIKATLASHTGGVEGKRTLEEEGNYRLIVASMRKDIENDTAKSIGKERQT